MLDEDYGDDDNMIILVW